MSKVSKINTMIHYDIISNFKEVELWAADSPAFYYK